MCCDDINDNNNAGEGACGTCLPYKDPVLITGQALSIGAILLSWTDPISFTLGLAAMIMLNVVFCCRMNKCGLITAGVFECIAAAGCMFFGFIFAFGLSCGRYATLDDDYYYYDNGTYYYSNGKVYYSCNLTVAASIAFSGAFLWIASATCTFIFACSRIQKYNTENDSEVQQATTVIPQGGADASTKVNMSSTVAYSQGHMAPAPIPREAETPMPPPPVYHSQQQATVKAPPVYASATPATDIHTSTGAGTEEGRVSAPIIAD